MEKHRSKTQKDEHDQDRKSMVTVISQHVKRMERRSLVGSLAWYHIHGSVAALSRPGIGSGREA